MKKQNLASPRETVDNYEQLKSYFRNTRWDVFFEKNAGMKVLFFHIPKPWHYHAIEPILLELQERGHQVVHYNEPGFRQYVQNAPFCFIRLQQL